MANSDPFSFSSMLETLPALHIPTARQTNEEDPPPLLPTPHGFSIPIPPPGFSQPRETNIPICSRGCDVSNLPQPDEVMTLHAIFNLMTNSQQDVANLFAEFFSRLNQRGLHKIASLLTSDSNYFMEIAKTECGSKRLQKLLGKSDDVDALFCDVILSCFLLVLTDKHASHVAVRAMRVCNQVIKETMYKCTLYYALQIACCQYGCIALNAIIIDLDQPCYRGKLLDIVADNALLLSNDPYGNFVIQYILRLNDLRCTHNIAVRLRGHCVELSATKHGSYIVERLLEAAMKSMVVVVVELSNCNKDRLIELARSEYGNFVVAKALRVTRELHPDYLFLFQRLVYRLKPSIELLRKSRRGRSIADILDSV